MSDDPGGDNERRPRSPGDARVERLQREAAVCRTHHAACACGQLAELRLMELCQRLERENAALREIARAVADADNSEIGVCHHLCRVHWVHVLRPQEPDEMELVHDGPCVVEQARALLA